jgi:hypothetical protein
MGLLHCHSRQTVFRKWHNWWPVRLATPSRNVHVTSVAVEGCLTVRRPCASDNRNHLNALTLISGEVKSLL